MARVSIEDCLKFMENRFALVAVASHRTRELMGGKAPLVRAKNKEAVIALREIASGLVGADRAVVFKPLDNSKVSTIADTPLTTTTPTPAVVPE